MSYVDATRVVRTLRALKVTLPQKLRGALLLSGEEFVGKMQRERFRGYTGPGRNTTDILQNRSKRLKNSIGYDVLGKTELEGMGLTVFSSGTPYARIQEYGGTIVPVNKKFLTIPLDAALTESGVSRYPSAAYLFDKYPKQMFVLKTKAGQLFVCSRGEPGSQPPPRPRVPAKNDAERIARLEQRVSRLKKGLSQYPSDIVFLYKLVTSVTIPPRLGFYKTWNDLADSRRARIERAVAAAVEAAKAS